jgi:wobble nucleotide-excising tRNase
MILVINKLNLIKSVGQFDSVTTAFNLRKLNLVYAENARGKTTLAAVMRSMSTGEAVPINERRRLGATQAPEAVIECTGNASPACFRNGAWSRTFPDVLVFDDFFVDRNVYSGMEVEAEHRQNLHELILGAAGVALARRVDDLAAEIRTRNTDLRNKMNAIPLADRHGLSVDDFCGLANRSDIDNTIKEAEQRLAALQNARTVKSTPDFTTLSLPTIDFANIEAILNRTIDDLDRSAANAVNAHFATVGQDAEAWVGTGMGYVTASNDGRQSNCPFCKQSLATSPIFDHYRAYFGQAYGELQAQLTAAYAQVAKELDGDALAGFERQVQTVAQRLRFWSEFTAVPDFRVDTSAVASAWQAVRDVVLSAISAKRADPLAATSLDADAVAKIEAYELAAAEVKASSDSLVAANHDIKRVKESVKGGSTVTVEIELKRLRATKARHSTTNSALCKLYLDEKRAKENADAQKAAAQAALDTHRRTVFPNYQTAINSYLSRLGAGFTLVRIESQPTAGRPSCLYSLLINGHPVPVGPNTAPSGSQTFKTTLSAGDRNTLALAFFFAALDQDPNRANRVVVLDDPMSSLDKHRRMATIQEIRTLLPTVAQVIVMSHDEHFLFDLYDRVAPRDHTSHSVIDTTSLCIGLAPGSSTICAWDIESEKLGRHDKRHALLMTFAAGRGADSMKVAQSIRPHLEHYLRVACPDKFKHGEMLRDFRNRANSAMRSGSPIISPNKFRELHEIVEFSNQFHHDTNLAADTVTINNTELQQYVTRTLAFVAV